MDVTIHDHGSIVLLMPCSAEGQAWLEEHTAPDAQWFGQALACEPRYVRDIVEGMEADGLVVE